MKLTAEQWEQIRQTYPAAYNQMSRYDIINEIKELTRELGQPYTMACRKAWIKSRLADVAVCCPHLYPSDNELVTNR
jgi:hypothetical protein